MELTRKANDSFGPRCQKTWSELTLVWSRCGQRLVKVGVAASQDSDERLMPSENLEVRSFWKVFVNKVGLVVFFSVKFW